MLPASFDLGYAEQAATAIAARGGEAVCLSSRVFKRKEVYMKINYVNPEHVHALIDLPTGYSIEEVVQLLKGASSHWINQNRIIPGKFAWGRGYGAFSVSQSNVGDVSSYIASQEEHHRKKSFAEEYKKFVNAYGLEWRDEQGLQNR